MPLNRRAFLHSSVAVGAGVSASAAMSVSADSVKKAATGVAGGESSRPLNPPTQHAREGAVDLLKPSNAELERGLELHRQSLVFDAYGFAPRAAVDGDTLAGLQFRV